MKRFAIIVAVLVAGCRGVRRLADVGRHAVAQHGVAPQGHAHHVGPQDRQERQVGGRAGLAVLRQSRCRRRCRADRHQQRSDPRCEAGRRSRRGDGVPRGDRRVHVAGDVREALVGPRQRLAVPGHRVVAARHRRHRLLRDQSRPGDRRRSRRLPRQEQRRRGEGRKAHGHERSGRDLDVRHDRRGRIVPAQPLQLVAGRRTRT